MAQSSQNVIQSVISEYTPRATSYDSSNSGWHADLADDLISWVHPQPGETVLDLACGTGLVTFRMASAVGPGGVVVGVDITPAMLDVARSQHRHHQQGSLSSTMAEITFIESDITSPTLLTTHPAISSVLSSSSRGGFDIISCCSAFILLPSPSTALHFWTTTSHLLRPGGRIIIDIPTEQRTVQFLATEILGARMGCTVPWSRGWVRGKESLERMFEEVGGLGVEMSMMTRSYLPERVFGRDDGGRVFDEEVLGRYGRGYVDGGRVEEARREWGKVWEEEVRKNQDEGGEGVVRDGHWLYVCVGRKKGG